MICLEHISKRFLLKPAGNSGLRAAVLGMLGQGAPRQEHWALRDISIEVPQGQSLALFGVNGSGKSTLLKLISGVMKPSSGRVDVSGRVGGVIELGAGFHGDLTGMENIFLHGTLMGLSRADIMKRLDAILDFAELGRFIHTPVRHYSMGMFLRLGFAIAVHTDPDILLIDEALAVGDGYFQWKCMRKIEEMKRQKKTLLYVTHVPNAAEAVCSHALWIHGGVARAYGAAQEVVRQYNDFLYGRLLENEPHDSPVELAALIPQARVGTGEVLITNAQLLDRHGQPRQAFESREPLTIEISAYAKRELHDVCIAYAIERPDQSVSVAYSGERTESFHLHPGENKLRVIFPELLLHAGNYYLTLSLYGKESIWNLYDCHIKMYTFTVTEPGAFDYSTRVFHQPTKIRWEELEARGA